MRDFDDNIHPEAEITDASPSDSQSEHSDDSEWEICSDDSSAESSQGRFNPKNPFARYVHSERSQAGGGFKNIYSAQCSQCSCFLWVLLLAILLMLIG